MRVQYQHLENFMKQRGQRIGKLPFLTQIQGGGLLGASFLAFMLWQGLPLPTAVRLPLLLLVLLSPILLLAIVQGEFLYKRLGALLIVALRGQMKRPRDLDLTALWPNSEEQSVTAVPIITSETILNQ